MRHRFLGSDPYASLLEKLGKPKQALKFLQGYETNFGTMMDAHVCHDVLAGLYLANGDQEAAKRNWEAGRTFARIVGCVDYVAVCSASLAQVYEGEGQVNAAERELEVALGHEPDSALRAKLLADLLRVELSLRNEEKAAGIFAEASRIAQKHGLSDVLINIHVYVGDYNWREDLKAKQAALKAYVAAIVAVLSKPDLELFPHVFGHIVTNLTSSQHLPTEEEFSSLIEGLKKEVPILKDRKRWVATVVLWPFEVARKLLPFVNDRKHYLAELEKATKTGPPCDGM